MNLSLPAVCFPPFAATQAAAIIIPGQSGTYRHLQDRVTGLLAETGQIRALRPAGGGVDGVIADAPLATI